MANLLEQLKAMTVVVADTGDIQAIENFRQLKSFIDNHTGIKKKTKFDKYFEESGKGSSGDDIKEIPCYKDSFPYKKP